MLPLGTLFSILAGVMGGLASASAKLALGAEHVKELCTLASERWFNEAEGVCESFHVVLRLGCMGLVFACNAVMWTFFVKALRFSSSSATATVTATAANFIFSVYHDIWNQRHIGIKAFLGKILLGELCTPLWWVGISVTLFGLLLLHTRQPPSEQSISQKKAN